jgi:hypothetical protein
VAEIEQRWAQVIGSARFADTCRALQQLLDELTSDQPTNDRPGTVDRPVPQRPTA